MFQTEFLEPIPFIFDPEVKSNDIFSALLAAFKRSVGSDSLVSGIPPEKWIDLLFPFDILNIPESNLFIRTFRLLMNPGVDDPDVDSEDVLDMIYTDKFTPEYCLWFETNCQGDSKDTTYIMNPPVDAFRYKLGFLYTFTGVDHSKTNKCTYTSLSVSRFRAGFYQNASDAVSSSQGLFSLTDLDYKYENPNDKIVEIDLVDDCTVSTGLNCLELDKDLIKPGDYLVFIERCYLEPATTFGPNPDELIRPVIQSFKKTRG